MYECVVVRTFLNFIVLVNLVAASRLVALGRVLNVWFKFCLRDFSLLFGRIVEPWTGLSLLF